MPDDKEVERLVEALVRAGYDTAWLADKDSRRGTNYFRGIAAPALRSAMRIGEKRAYEDAAKTVVESRFVTKARLSNELQADSLKGE